MRPRPEVASDAAMLAGYRLAVAREPRSRRFLWRRAIWASAVGAEADLTAACDALLPFDDMVDLIERCRSFSSRPATRPTSYTKSRNHSNSKQPPSAPTIPRKPTAKRTAPMGKKGKFGTLTKKRIIGTLVGYY